MIDNYSDLGLERAEALAIGDICPSHRQIKIEEEIHDRAVKYEKIRLRFLGACLRLADACDITYERASELVSKIIRPPLGSKEHFDKHLSVAGVVTTPGKEIIEISGIAYTGDGERILHALRDEIQEELSSVRSLLEANGVPARMVELEIEQLDIPTETIRDALGREESLPRIIVMSGQTSGKEYVVDRDMGVGRNPENDICIPSSDRHASRIHARIHLEDGECFVEDLGSLNGTFVRGKFLSKGEKAKLRDGDMIKVGNTLLLFKKPGAAREDADEAGDRAQRLPELLRDRGWGDRIPLFFFLMEMTSRKWLNHGMQRA